MNDPLTDPALFVRPFNPIAIVPEQFFRTAATACDIPEKRLMLAVIEDAWNMAIRPIKGRRGQRLQEEARDWFLSDDSQWIYSFISICEYLDLEDSEIRKAVLLNVSQESTQGRPIRRKEGGR